MSQGNELYPKGRTLREGVRNQLRARIFDGEYPPGTPLVERDLAQEFNVSRLPVREALRMLRQEGLVRERSSRGVEVSFLSAKEAADLFDLRLHLEVLAGRLAAVNATQEDLRRLEDLLDDTEDALKRGAVLEVHRASADFHEQITALARNRFLRSALEPVQGRMRWISLNVADAYALLREHRELLAAIASGDAESAAERSQIHVEKSRRQFVALPNGGGPGGGACPRWACVKRASW